MQDDQLSELYQIRFPDKDLPRKNAIWRILCDHFFSRYIDPSDTVIDIASGNGEFSNHIHAKHKIAVDLNPDAKKYLAREIEFFQCNALELSTIGQNKADTIFTSNFLEHLPGKKELEDFLDQVMAALKPGGKYLILGPNLRYLPGQYWDFYDHHLGLTHLSLCEVLKLRGFTIDVCIDRFLPYTTQGKMPTHPWLVLMYLKIPLAWKILGKQFFIVAKKPYSTSTAANSQSD